MYLWLKLQKESKEYLKVYFPSEPWTAEFAFGWRLKHRPWITLFAFIECFLEVGLFLLICVIFSH